MLSNCSQKQGRGSASTLTDYLCSPFSWSNVTSWPTSPQPPPHPSHPRHLHSGSPSTIHHKWQLLRSAPWWTLCLNNAPVDNVEENIQGHHQLWLLDSELSTLFSLNLEPLPRFLSEICAWTAVSWSTLYINGGSVVTGNSKKSAT